MFRVARLVLASPVLLLASAAVLGEPIAPPAGTGSTAAAVRYNEGLAALARNDAAGAESAFREASKLDPKSPLPLLGLAEIAVKRAENAAAAEWLKRAETVAPRSAAVHGAWGRYYFSRRQYPKAEAAYLKAISLDPAAARARVDLADLYINHLDRASDAAEAYRAAIAVQPEHAGAHYGLGMALVSLSRGDEAARAFETAARLAPTNPLPLQALGRLHATGKRYDDALNAFSRLLDIESDYVVAHIDRSDVFIAKGDLAKAHTELVTAIRKQPKFTLAHLKLGMLHQRQQRWPDAEAAYLKTIQLDPKNAAAYNNLAWMTAERRTNLDQGLAWAKKAVSLQPKASASHDTLAWVQRARGDLRQALASLKQAAALPPRSAEVLYHLGVVSSELGMKEQARSAFRDSLALDPQSSFADDARSRLDGVSGS